MQAQRRSYLWPVGLAALLMVSLSLAYYWPQPRQAVYTYHRSFGKARTITGLQGFNVKSSDHFDVYFRDSDEDITELVLQTAEEIYGPVVDLMGFVPAGPIPLIIEPTRDAMRRAFGWTQGQSAMGVYWHGTIRLLSPHEWLPDAADRTREKVFHRLNPIAHELTHYILDHMTSGNYPRWFTEGLAQWVEYQVTGYMWLEGSSTLRQPLYTYEELNRQFDRLALQPLAYRQSYLMVLYLEERYGRESLMTLITALTAGRPFEVAMVDIYGVDGAELYALWQLWVLANLDELDLTGL